MDSNEALRLYGTAEEVAAPRRLAAGQLSCRFEAGALRQVCWGEVEIARGIAYLLRDRDWGTTAAEMSALVVDESPQRFSVDFVLRMGALEGVARIEGHADGRLAFSVRATPESVIETNRCGFVVLHPAAVAGQPLSVEHTDGAVDETAFPHTISPSQPVFDIRCLRYAPAQGVRLECRLEAELPGDAAAPFEMEDQRNWSDASFKTYVGSLLDPWPYRLPAGRAFTQRVELTVSESALDSIRTPRRDNELSLGPASPIRLPPIGVGIPPGLHAATPAERQALQDLGAQWWILDADLADPGLANDLAATAALRREPSPRVQLDLVVPADLSPDDAARRGAALCAQAGLTVDALRLLPAPYLKSYQPSATWPDLPPLEAYAEAARRHFDGALVGGGMFTYFTELNRKRPSADGLDFIGHATCPIVHAADDASVMQTLEALPAIVHSVRSLWPGLPYRLGPSTLASRRNPYGDAPAANPERRRIALADADPRHAGQFAAAWTLGYAAAVMSDGLGLLALHHSHGPSGPFAGADAQSLVPCWAVLRTLAGAAGAALVPLIGGAEALAGLAWSHDGVTIDGLLANLGAEEISLQWQGGRLVLGAYAVVPIHSRHAAVA